jgi:glycosyltransferase involved in cell wall biosynthesis
VNNHNGENDLLEMENENDLDFLLDDDLFIKEKKRYNILFLSDHPLCPSGVGVQSKIMIDGLVATGKYTFKCLGGAIKHQDYRTIQVNENFYIHPVDGFGTPDMVRQLLITEKPDAIVIFTDPRQFIWLYEIEDEVRSVCPIVYNTIWDNDPVPLFNKPLYDATDVLNCISHKTYELIKPLYPEKTNYISHAFPKDMYFPIEKEKRDKLLEENFGDKKDWFKVIWVSRNATRKLPGDLLLSWKMFLDKLEETHGHRKALLIMHTDPFDKEGPNLVTISDSLGLHDNVWFSAQKLSFAHMNVLHNMSDTCVSVSKNEGHGLSLTISLQVGKPIIALKTGGQTRQVEDYRDGTHNGVALEPSKRCLVGSQQVPYIYEDFYDHEELTEAFLKVHDYTDEEKEAMSKKCIAYADHEFNVENTIKKWDESLEKCIEDFKSKSLKRWECINIEPEILKPGEASKVKTHKSLGKIKTPPKPAPAQKELKDIKDKIKSVRIA